MPGNPRTIINHIGSQKPLINARRELPPGAGTSGCLTWQWLCAVTAMVGGRLQRPPSSALGPALQEAVDEPDQPGPSLVRCTRAGVQDLLG